MRIISGRFNYAVTAALAIMGSACSGSNDSVTASGAGGTSGVTGASGGLANSGGLNGSGGSFGTGGIIATGGRAATGGAVATGGKVASGGGPATGGMSETGGRAATGGAVATGGKVASGGGPGTGGAAAGGTNAGGKGSGGTPASGGSGVTKGGSDTGGDVGTGGASTGAGGGTSAPSAGCGKTSTLTFGTVPGEDPSAASGSGNGVGHGDGGYVTIQSSGQTRGFALRLPDNYDKNKPYWLIFGFHWNGGNSAQVDNGGTNGYWWSYYGLQRESNNGAIFVAPNGLNAGWANSGGQDLKFVDDMVALIEANYCVDTTNIITSGFSYGGGMSYELACARAKVFRAAVIYEGGQISGCDGGNDPIALWQVEGLTDTTVGMSLATPIRDRFVKNNGCTAQSPPQPAAPPPYLNPGGHICTDYSGCSAGHPVRWCVSQSGHGPGPIDGSSDLYNSCATPPKTCSASCPCTWTPDDVWPWLNGQSMSGQTPNATK